MPEEKRSYLSYLLRLWQVEENAHTTWRLSIESARTGECVGFTDLDTLCCYLRDCFGVSYTTEEGERSPSLAQKVH